MMKHGMTLFQLSYDIVANIAGARTRNPHVNVVPAAFVANLQNDVTTKSKKRFFSELQPHIECAVGENRTRPFGQTADALTM
jgi:hypothetical protein